MEVFPVTIEADISSGLPKFDVVGLPDSAVSEARDRVHSAIKNCGFTFPVSRITLNLAPADRRKEGPIYDLAMFITLLLASDQLNVNTDGYAFLGELSLDGKICMDVGASTGGFTDCMLMNGAVKVYSIDVGYGQLAWKLRSDERVVNLERTNFRYVTREQVPDEIDFSSVDVSFISLKLILPVLYSLLKADGEAVCLVKPQFEAGREKIGKKGVVRDKAVHLEVIDNCIGYARESGFKIKGLDFSPVKGPEGNIEYLLYITKSEIDEPETDASMIVNNSHETLDKE